MWVATQSLGKTDLGMIMYVLLTPLGMKYPPTTKSSWVTRPLPGRTGNSLHRTNKDSLSLSLYTRSFKTIPSGRRPGGANQESEEPQGAGSSRGEI